MEPSHALSTKKCRGIAIRLFVTCWIIYVLHFATNIVRELYPAMALGDRFSFDVSDYVGLHPDIFDVEGRGAFINNNPGASIAAAVPYLATRPVIDRITSTVQARRAANPNTSDASYDSPWPMAREFYRRTHEKGWDIKFGLAAAVSQSLLMSPLSALSVVVMFYVISHLTSSVRAGLWLAILYAFATPVFYRTAQLNQNLLAAHCAFFSFILLWQPFTASGPRRYFLAGLLAGGSVVFDYSGVIVVLVLSIYGLVSRQALPPEARKTSDALRFSAGVFLAGCVLMGYQWTCFGNPFYPAQHYMPPANFTEMGYVGFSWPKLDLLWATAFNHRYGLFFSAPLLILLLWIPGWRSNGAESFGTRERVCIVVFTILFFLFCSANQYGRMQFNTGVRHVVPVVPFLFVLAALVLYRMPPVAAICVGATCTFWSWCLSMYREVELGRGIVEAPIHILKEGPRLPWMTTLQRTGSPLATYFSEGVTAAIVLAGAGLLIAAVWWPWRSLVQKNMA